MLRPSWDLVEEWMWREPPQKRTPAAPVAVRAMVSVAGAWNWHGMGLTIWLAFHCLLRPGEAIALRKKDIRFTRTWGSRARVAVVVILEPKTRRRAARTQHVLAEEPILVRVLENYLRGLQPEGRLFPLSEATFGKRFDQILTALGIQRAFTPAGLHAGGATEERLRLRDCSTLRLRGRWMIPGTLEHYVQGAAAALNMAQVSTQQLIFLEAMAAETLEVWEVLI